MKQIRLKYDSVEIFHSESSFYKIYNVPVFNYLLEGIMIDTSFPRFGKGLLNEISNLVAILLTHEHVDHSGNAGILAKNFNCPVYAHSSALSSLKKGTSLSFVFRRLFGNRVEKIDPLDVPSKLETDNFTLQAIPLPGHSPCSTGYYEPERKWLFTGDAVPLNEHKRDCFDFENMPETLETLKKIAKMPLNALFTGHKGVIINVQPFLSARIEYLEKLKNQIFRLRKEGMNSFQIRQVIFQREKLYSYFICGDRSSLNLIRSFLINKAVIEITKDKIDDI